MAEKKKPAQKKTTKKSSSAQTHSGVDSISLHKENVGQIEDLIKQAFLRFYNTTYTNNAKEKDLNHLNLIMEEYLRSYMVLGYDLNGEKICIMTAHNDTEKDALIEHLRSTLVSILNSNPN